jgi:hypothetical protein
MISVLLLPGSIPSCTSFFRFLENNQRQKQDPAKLQEGNSTLRRQKLQLVTNNQENPQLINLLLPPPQIIPHKLPGLLTYDHRKH